MYLSVDKVCCEDEFLAQCYQKLISSNKTLEFVSFDCKFSVKTANAVATGLLHNSTLKTLEFSSGLLTNDSLALLLKSVYESAITRVHITEGCCLTRLQRNRSFAVDFTGDSTLLCKVYCASAKIFEKHCVFLTMDSPFSQRRLDLSKRKNTDGDIDLTEVFRITMDGLVSTLVLSNTKMSFNKQLLLSHTCVLEELRLNNCYITDSDCEGIARGLIINKCLKVLDLQSNYISSFGAMILLKSIAKNSVLQILDIAENDLSDQKENLSTSSTFTAESTCKNNALIRLNLGFCNPLFVDMFFTMTTFSKLAALSLEIKDEELLADVFDLLKNSDSLEEFNITRSSLRTCTIADTLRKLLQCNNSIKTLNMCSCDISDNVCKVITRGLAENNHIEKLDLSNNNICGEGVLAVFQILEDNKCPISELDLSSNRKPNRARNITAFELENVTLLLNNKTLKTLIVSDFEIFSEWFGVKLFEGLTRNRTLYELDISSNVLDVDAFVRMLSWNNFCTITKLNISWSGFFVWNSSIVDALLKCSSLKTLIVDPVLKEALMFENESQTFDEKIEIISDIGLHSVYLDK